MIGSYNLFLNNLFPYNLFLINPFSYNLFPYNLFFIFQFFKENLLHERLKPSVCQNGLVNSRKNFFFCRNVLWDQILLCSTKRLSPKVPMSPLSWQTFNLSVDPEILGTWTVLNLNAKGKRDTYSGRPKSARSQENIDAIRDSLGRSPRKSLRRHSQELGINRESIRRILVKDLQLYLYRIQIKHKLTQADMEKPCGYVSLVLWQGWREPWFPGRFVVLG